MLSSALTVTTVTTSQPLCICEFRLFFVLFAKAMVLLTSRHERLQCELARGENMPTLIFNWDSVRRKFHACWACFSNGFTGCPMSTVTFSVLDPPPQAAPVRTTPVLTNPVQTAARPPVTHSKPFWQTDNQPPVRSPVVPPPVSGAASPIIASGSRTSAIPAFPSTSRPLSDLDELADDDGDYDMSGYDMPFDDVLDLPPNLPPLLFLTPRLGLPQGGLNVHTKGEKKPLPRSGDSQPRIPLWALPSQCQWRISFNVVSSNSRT